MAGLIAPISAAARVSASPAAEAEPDPGLALSRVVVGVDDTSAGIAALRRGLELAAATGGRAAMSCCTWRQTVRGGRRPSWS
jgi:hypothetical protein